MGRLSCLSKQCAEGKVAQGHASRYRKNEEVAKKKVRESNPAGWTGRVGRRFVRIFHACHPNARQIAGLRSPGAAVIDSWLAGFKFGNA